jgi:hypothetical protein
MRWFKHFVDNNRSQEMLQIKRELGMGGIGSFWCLVEACSESMEKARDERFSEDHCHFSFDKSYLANILGCKPCRISKILGVFEGRNLLQKKANTRGRDLRDRSGVGSR